MPIPPQPYQLSWHGWISIDYNQNIWIPCPPVFPDGINRESWAKLYAEEWWSRTAGPYGKRQIRAMKRMLSEIHTYAYDNLAMHRGFLHMPAIGLSPLLVSFGIWEAVGDRDEQMRFLTRANDPTLMQPPVIEEFGTEKLGQGIKVTTYTRNNKGVVTGYLNYAWRNEELATAVRMFTGSPDLGRLQDAVHDIEELARTVAWVPWDRKAAQAGHSA
jgi:hypothetical protein